ncbi:MAG: DUF58 domain-containing protein [Kiritimatiellaeota bacterium]|nr:DUF58 domain-containing protein [Kiritimatiellota bacterium]
MAETGIRAFLSPRQMASLNRLMLNARSVVEGTLAGRHRSAQRGASTEFADHRAYQSGDDLKRIDWKVLGRTDKYFIRRYQDETNLRVYLFVDKSASMDYASVPERPTKFRYASMLASAIGYVVLKARDSAGMYIYGEALEATLPCKNGFNDLNNALTILQNTKPGKKTQGAEIMNQVAESINRRAMVVIISDLLEEPEEMIKAIAHFRKNNHDVIVFHVLDPAELELTIKRGATFEDLETGERLVADPRALAAEYREVFGAFLDRYRKACSEMKVDYRICRTDEEPETFVKAYLEERKRASR